MAFRVLGAAALSLAPGALAYSELHGYMPVSDVTEHAQIVDDVTLMFEALGTSVLEAGEVYAQAKCIYEDGGGNSCKSESTARTLQGSTARTLQGFAQEDLTGETYADMFSMSGFATGFWDTEITHALSGTGVYDGLSDTMRVTSIKRAVLGLITYYASHSLEDAIDKAKEIIWIHNHGRGLSDENSGHAWDEGWAIYRGPAEDGEDAAWEVAGKLDSNFPDGVAVATAIVPYFNAGLIAVRNATYDAAAAEYARDVIYKMWSITYLRAALKSLEICETTYSEQAHAEGYSYWMAIDGWWSSYHSLSGQSMREALDITKTSIDAGTFCTTKALMEAAYPIVGIDCDMVGTFEDSTISCDATCGAAAVTFDAGADMVAAVDGVEESDVTCGDYACQEDTTTGGESASKARAAGAALAGAAALALAAL